ncbi:hypothetical protein CC79DRAFT_1398947 [Sarocladium strictum]
MEPEDFAVVPLPLLNATVGNVTLMARTSVIFNAQLSFRKLHDAWIKALRVRPIMQAVMRRSQSAPSGLVYHVRTPVGLSKYLKQQALAPNHLKDLYFLDESHRSIQDYCPAYGQAAMNAKASGRIFISDGPMRSEVKRCTAFNAVESIEELLGSERPHNTIQVTRFSDATVITMSVNHAFGDLITLKAYFKAWEAALNGQTVEPFQNEEVDPFAPYGPGGEFAEAALAKNPRAPPQPPPGWHVYSMLDKARFLRRSLWDYYIARPESTIKDKRIFIPASQVQALEDTAKLDLRLLLERREREELGKELKKPIYVSQGDVIYAWLLKQIHAHLPSDQESTACTIANGRFKPPSPLTSDAPELANNDLLCAAMAIALPTLTAGMVASMSLGELALHVRGGIKAHASPESLRDWLIFQLYHSGFKKPSGQVVVPWAPHHFVTGVTDWTMVHLEQLDFAAARLDGDRTVPAIPCAIDGHMALKGTRRDFFICLGDVNGGIWILGYASENQWKDPKGFGKYDKIERGKTTSKL